jgi:hypothetical protein
MRVMRKFALVVMILLLLSAIPTMASAEANASVAGSTFLAGGSPLPGVTITASNTTGPDSYQTSSGSSGTYNISLPAGIYNISASLTGFAPNTSYSFVLVGAEGVLLDFTLTIIPGEVRGFVTNGSTPVYGATVQISDGLRSYSATSTAPLGLYVIPAVQPGAYSGQAYKMGYNTSIHLGVITVIAAKVTYVNFSLEEQPASLTGKTTMADGTTPLEGVTVKLASPDLSVETTSDANGHYSLQRIPAGTYTLSYAKSGYLTQTYTMNFNPYEAKSFDARLERSATNPNTYLFGYDLAHSLMLVGLILAIVTMIAAMYLVFRLAKRPDLLMRMEEETPEEEEEKKD